VCALFLILDVLFRNSELDIMNLQNCWKYTSKGDVCFKELLCTGYCCKLQAQLRINCVCVILLLPLVDSPREPLVKKWLFKWLRILNWTRSIWEVYPLPKSIFWLMMKHTERIASLPLYTVPTMRSPCAAGMHHIRWLPLLTRLSYLFIGWGEGTSGGQWYNITVLASVWGLKCKTFGRWIHFHHGNLVVIILTVLHFGCHEGHLRIDFNSMISTSRSKDYIVYWSFSLHVFLTSQLGQERCMSFVRANGVSHSSYSKNSDFFLLV
jgi:hypothetical protein